MPRNIADATFRSFESCLRDLAIQLVGEPSFARWKPNRREKEDEALEEDAFNSVHVAN